MKSLGSVTLIIVNYRSAKLVGELLESIARRGAGWVDRVIVVDNASGDGSVEALRAKAAALGIGGWVEVLDAGRNGGFGAGNNFGAAAALRAEKRPDLLWFLNPDTLVDGVDLGQAVEWFESRSTMGIVGTGLNDAQGMPELAGHRAPSPIGEFVQAAGSFILLRRFAMSDSALDRPGPVDWVSGASLIMRSSTFEQLCGFDEGFFLYFEEVDICQRARQAGWEVVYEPRVRVVHLEGQSTGRQSSQPQSSYWYESRKRFFIKHRGVDGLIAADIGWGLGTTVGKLMRRPRGQCRWHELWRCDKQAILGPERATLAGPSRLLKDEKSQPPVLGVESSALQSVLRPKVRMVHKLQAAVGRCGIGDLFASVTNLNGAVVVMYHSVPPPELESAIAPSVRKRVEIFQRQIEFFSRHRRVVSMTELGDLLAGGRTAPRGTVVLTFDDGYLDTLRVAAPILAAAELPATLYLPTWYIDQAKPQWIDELWHMFRTKRSRRVETELGNRDASTERAAKHVMDELSSAMLEASLEERERLLSQARESLNPSERLPRLTMNWDEVRTLVREYPRFELGGHTVGHLDLRKWTGPVAATEITDCADTIERQTGTRPRHFSFPYGRWCSETKQMVQLAGYQTAVGAGRDVLLDNHSDRWALPRVDGQTSVARLRFLTSGAYPRMPLVSRA